MDILLDTHVAIWFFEDNKRLSKSATDAITNLENSVYVSIVSLWEIAIKLSKGKLEIDNGLDGFVEAVYRNGFILLGISPAHIKIVCELPFIHHDPFDRMMIAQAIVEDMSIVSADENIAQYDASLLW